MVIDVAFPAFKLGLLALRQLVRPISNRIVEHGKENPAFRKYILCNSAQAYNRLWVLLKLRSLDLRAPFKIPSLPEAEAAKLGADLVSELFVFGLFVGIAIFEYNRQLLVEAFKNEKIGEEKQEILDQLKNFNIKLSEHDKIIEGLLANAKKLEFLAKTSDIFD